MIVRKATKEDLPQLTGLFNAYRVFYKAPADATGAEQFLAERMQNGESVVFVAEEKKHLLGFVQLYPLFSSVSMRRVWLLNDLFTVPEARKKGIATALMNTAKEFATSTKAARMILQTSRDNYTAQKLYEANGWKMETDFYYILPLL